MPFTGILAIILIFLGLYGYLFLRHWLGNLRRKDSYLGGVQHAPKLAPEHVPAPVLPGSRLGERVEGRPKELDSLEVKATFKRIPKKTARRRGIISSKSDIRKSYIVDALLERPKF